MQQQARQSAGQGEASNRAARVIRALSQHAVRALGWKAEGDAPPLDKYVLVAAPHTSNWDLLYMLLIGAELGVRPSWMGKHTLFRGPAGTVLRALGGIPIDRRSANDVVRQMATAFSAAERMVLAIPPEGTRKHTEYWKSGFYHVARAAGVPIVLTYLDYGRKKAGFGPVLDSRRTAREVMDDARAFYRDVTPRHAADFGPVRLREE